MIEIQGIPVNLIGLVQDWLVVFYVPSTRLETAPPFTVPCEGREALCLHQRESSPGPSRGSPLHYCCATPTPLLVQEEIIITSKFSNYTDSIFIDDYNVNIIIGHKGLE